MESSAQASTPHSSVAGSINGAGHVRTRPPRPCDACRRRKSRCELVEGEKECVLCKFHRQSCLFQEEPQPRKKRKTSNTGEDNDQNRQPPLPLEQDGPLEETEGRALIRQHQPIDDYANLKGPSLLKKTLGLQSHRHSRFVGSTSVFEQSLLARASFNEKDEIPLGPSVLRKVDERNSFVLLPDLGTQNRDEEIADLDAVETIVAPHGKALIHLYFRIVHPSFPILHKKVYLEKYKRTHREFSPPLLAAVYILALNWWSYSADLALLPKPDVVSLERLAAKTLSYVAVRPKLSHIQAGLLLLQRPEGDSWALTTKLVGLGQDLGLHLDCSRWRIPSWERGLRKRLAWALFMQDKWGSLVHGRPSHITPADWMVRPVTEHDFPERAADEDEEEGSAEVEKGRILFCEMIRLTEILTSILTEFYTLRAEDDFRQHAHEGGRWVLEKAKPIQIRLKDWFTQLPDCLKMENVKMRKLNSAGYLHLAYYAAEITLHRQILRSLAEETDGGLINICRSAAQTRLKTVTDFVRSLRPEHLQSFWYSASKYCFAVVGTFIGLLWITATTKEEAKGYKDKLEEYRWTLRLSSKSAEFLDRAISMLTTSTGLLVKAIPDNRPSGNGSITVSPMVEQFNGLKGFDGEDERVPEEEEWTASGGEVSLGASPTQFSEEALEMLWPDFSMDRQAYAMSEEIPVQQSGFSLQPFLGVDGDFDVPTAYQPHYGVSSTTHRNGS
ncbi:hypothetical protein EJ08DRAFT_302414 [Tothia fuscella]|uniref:Zn(2)-C6 fungal-type domain-containing protein n=1 Tax=Tothia fuscella TaxID=1048955 RepID=A0A9P4TX43_9PEZI|nr:hypothetical protein EJ08DRAFT_302414 [Tothia fuscella]